MRGDRLYRTEAIVLRRHDLGEADRILTLHTPRYGKLKAVARGVRRPLSRKAGHLELFTRADLQLARGRDLDVIAQVETLETYFPLRQDLARVAYAAYFVELVDSFTGEQDENLPLYRLLADGLQWLCTVSDLRHLARYYELHLLSLVGFRPQLDTCVSCGHPLRPEAQFYSQADGGVLCLVCGESRQGARMLSFAALKVLRHVQRSSYSEIADLHLRPATLNEIEHLLGSAIAYHLEYRPKSLAFLLRLRRELRSRAADR